MRAGIFDDGETFDLSWMDLPEGHSRISTARHANDVVLRFFHRRVEAVSLDFMPDADAESVFRRALLIPPREAPPWHELNVWLSMRPTEPMAAVMVGDSKVGAAAVPWASWTVMLSEGADRGVYSDGTLKVTGHPGSNGAVTLGPLRCWLPRRAP